MGPAGQGPWVITGGMQPGPSRLCPQPVPPHLHCLVQGGRVDGGGVAGGPLGTKNRTNGDAGGRGT